MRFRSAVVAVLTALMSTLAAGCSTRSVTAPEPNAPPAADTPEHLVQRLQWAWRNRSLDVYRTLFTSDYAFVSSVLDSSGNPFRNSPWTRVDELASARLLFVTGTATEPPASAITLDFDNALAALPDPRPGMNPRWHRRVGVEAALGVRLPSGSLRARGFEDFFLVRGDSAAIPQDLDLAPDSTRWYVALWTDNAVAASADTLTAWGQIKTLYR